MRNLYVCISVVSLCFFLCMTAVADHQNSLADHGFDSYVSQEQIQQASDGADPAFMTDVALQLAEGERVLHRSRRGITSAQMMKMAAKVAVNQGDNETLSRINRAVTKLGDNNLAREINQISRQQPTKVDRPSFQTGNDNKVESILGGILDSIDNAVKSHNKRGVDDAYGSSSGYNFGDDLRRQLEDHADRARKAIPRDDDSDALHSFNSHRRDDDGGWNNSGNNRPSSNAEGSWGPADLANLSDDADPPKHKGFGNIAAVIADPNSGRPPYHAERFRAEFIPTRRGAKITTIHAGSPLKGRLNVGDIITYLDGIKVDSSWELENHNKSTVVDYLDFATGGHRRATVFVR